MPLGRGTLAFTVYQSRLKIFLPNPPEKNEPKLEGTPVVEAKDSRDTIIRLTVFLRSLAFASRRRVNSTSQHFQNFGIVFELQGPDVGLRVCRSAWQIGPFSRAPPPIRHVWDVPPAPFGLGGSSLFFIFIFDSFVRSRDTEDGGDSPHLWLARARCCVPEPSQWSRSTHPLWSVRRSFPHPKMFPEACCQSPVPSRRAAGACARGATNLEPLDDHQRPPRLPATGAPS